MSFAFIIRHIHHFVNSLECVSLVIMQNDQIPLSFRKRFKSIREIFKQLIVNKRIIGQRIRRNLIPKFDMYFSLLIVYYAFAAPHFAFANMASSFQSDTLRIENL